MTADAIDYMVDRPVFVVAVHNGNDEQVASIVAHSTAEGLATYLDRLPAKGRLMFAMNVRSLTRKHDDAMRRWDRHGNEAAGRRQLTCPRYIGNPDDAYLFVATVEAVL